MSSTGSVKNYNPFKGFGFITGADGQDVFVHVSACNGMAPSAGDVVTYDVTMNDKTGKPNASNVQGCTGSADAAAKGGGKGAAGTGTCSGTVKSYNGEKGWGFVESNGQDFFLHVKNCNGGTPNCGDWLTFDVEDAGQGNGKLKAVNVTGCTGWPQKGKGKGDKGGYGGMWDGGKGDWGKGGGKSAGPYGGGKGDWGKGGGWSKGGW
eukprot:CAMPEP_0177527690 /NCGR_PEP_ID=MMETSP0369-20130122/51788_1 /TAXON_ID=447022 ORGANISM="Scrippsiella hangoei-like, Strain SHHI-4" /NCGR_SAMPLE_ID=MMETSP0369 /ASSEMBLY_ACC=CAM_ASM_000364 /LENGTH=206 /DNA_ID=CAMNT_0019008071 /DNA_START=80 /DNA_END=700 /DNA_ORIENTATION=+